MDPKAFCDILETNGIRYFTGVPDSLLKEICGYITTVVPKERNIIAENEGGAVALAMGYHLATSGLPLVYLQNSGIGNTINPLLSLADPAIYGVPMILLIGWRGEPGVKDEPQHQTQGRVNEALLDALEIPHRVLPDTLPSAETTIAELVKIATTEGRPVACMVRKGTFDPFKIPETAQEKYPQNREDSVKVLVKNLDPRDIVVSTTGKASRELFECRRELGHDHSRDFLTVGGMGHASLIALGIASQLPDRRVICFDGDGAALMHLGSLPIVGTSNAGNFVHVLLNNGAHDSVGGQPTVGFDINFCQIAEASGYGSTTTVEDAQAFEREFQAVNGKRGPHFIEFKARKGARADLGRPTTTPKENKSAFMDFLKEPAP